MIYYTFLDLLTGICITIFFSKAFIAAFSLKLPGTICPRNFFPLDLLLSAFPSQFDNDNKTNDAHSNKSFQRERQNVVWQIFVLINIISEHIKIFFKNT